MAIHARVLSSVTAPQAPALISESPPRSVTHVN